MRDFIQLCPVGWLHDPSSQVLTDICRTVRDSVDPPVQSKFRVASLIVFEDSQNKGQGPWYATGCNCEAANISLCICAERSALLKIRETGIKEPRILAIHLISDADYPITPGPLCREMLSEYALPSTPVIMAASDPAKPCNFLTLADLYPYPPLYSRIDSTKLESHCERFASEVERCVDKTRLWELLSVEGCNAEPEMVMQLMANLVNEAKKPNATSNLHPIRYAAGVLYDDGSMLLAQQHNAFEFGSTLDALSMLANDLHKRKESGHLPLLLLHADHAGILHAPVATARAWLHAFGFTSVPLLLHSPTGKLVCTRVSQLLPHFQFTPCNATSSVKALFEISAREFL